MQSRYINLSDSGSCAFGGGLSRTLPGHAIRLARTMREALPEVKETASKSNRRAGFGKCGVAEVLKVLFVHFRS